MTERVVDDHMRAYYDARAPEYDDWWLGTGRFEQRERPGWDEEVEQLVALLRGLPPARTLDVACGTGFLTRHLPGAVVGLDQSLAMLDVAARQAPAALLVQGDAVPLPFGDGEFERLHASHFYGHLLEDERTAFLAEARRVAGELVDRRRSRRRHRVGDAHAQRRLAAPGLQALVLRREPRRRARRRRRAARRALARRRRTYVAASCGGLRSPTSSRTTSMPRRRTTALTPMPRTRCV